MIIIPPSFKDIKKGGGFGKITTTPSYTFAQLLKRNEQVRVSTAK